MGPGQEKQNIFCWPSSMNPLVPDGPYLFNLLNHFAAYWGRMALNLNRDEPLQASKGWFQFTVCKTVIFQSLFKYQKHGQGKVAKNAEKLGRF